MRSPTETPDAGRRGAGAEDHRAEGRRCRKRWSRCAASGGARVARGQAAGATGVLSAEHRRRHDCAAGRSARSTGSGGSRSSGGKRRATGAPLMYEGTPRNAKCPCGSGRTYKRCHGDPAHRRLASGRCQPICRAVHCHRPSMPSSRSAIARHRGPCWTIAHTSAMPSTGSLTWTDRTTSANRCGPIWRSSLMICERCCARVRMLS